MDKRVDWIDISKGIGIIVMICGHIGMPSILDLYIHAWHMPIFFILSGYLFKEYDVISLIKKKSKSLLIPYLSFGFILYFFSIVKNCFKHNIDLFQQLIDLFTYNTVGNLPFGNVLWFLTSLFFVEIIFGILKKYIKKDLELFIVIMFICIIGWLFSLFNIRFMWGLDSALTSIGFYYFGYIIKKNDKFIRTNKIFIRVPTLFILTSLSIFINGEVNVRTTIYNNLLLFYINAILTSIMIFTIVKYIEKKGIFEKIKKGIIYIGKNSLIFMCLNQLIIYISGLGLNIVFSNQIFIRIITLIISILILSILSNIINLKFKFIIGKSNLNISVFQN
ncbi:acyltransferase family protein [Clostridium butyricum]|uniref:acyltransferase family protein n=1 Tax=Clostridium butyricum TaxID=1492 RepID=UPI00090372B6|nr:acyltransferase family protein [Clostridium butyricum]APF21112.1 acyltransferase family protein [Clostridium butyricum]